MREIMIRYVRDGLRGRAESVVDFFATTPAEQRATLEAWADAEIAKSDAAAAEAAGKRAEIADWRDGAG